MLFSVFREKAMGMLRDAFDAFFARTAIATTTTVGTPGSSPVPVNPVVTTSKPVHTTRDSTLASSTTTYGGGFTHPVKPSETSSGLTFLAGFLIGVAVVTILALYWIKSRYHGQMRCFFRRARLGRFLNWSRFEPVNLESGESLAEVNEAFSGSLSVASECSARTLDDDDAWVYSTGRRLPSITEVVEETPPSNEFGESHLMTLNSARDVISNLRRVPSTRAVVEVPPSPNEFGESRLTTSMMDWVNQNIDRNIARLATSPETNDNTDVVWVNQIVNSNVARLTTSFATGNGDHE